MVFFNLFELRDLGSHWQYSTQFPVQLGRVDPSEQLVDFPMAWVYLQNPGFAHLNLMINSSEAAWGTDLMDTPKSVQHLFQSSSDHLQLELFGVILPSVVRIRL